MGQLLPGMPRRVADDLVDRHAGPGPPPRNLPACPQLCPWNAAISGLSLTHGHLLADVLGDSMSLAHRSDFMKKQRINFENYQIDR